MEKIMVVFDAKGMFPRQYEQVMRDLKQSGEAAPDGRLNHFASEQEGGMMVVDVWESQQKLERFAGVLIPILVKNSVPPPPQGQLLHPIPDALDGLRLAGAVGLGSVGAFPVATSGSSPKAIRRLAEY